METTIGKGQWTQLKCLALRREGLFDELADKPSWKSEIAW
jgi:hypothetical protein